MKIAFTSAHSPLAEQALAELTKRYGQQQMANADMIVALGGDGHVLKTLYDAMPFGKPVFAMRRTESVGFLCNNFSLDNLMERLEKAYAVTLHPLHYTAASVEGIVKEGLSINEVTVMRETPQSSRLRIMIDGIERMAHYSGDGLLVSTSAGSTAYNHSCGGPIMPLDANTLVITAISGYRPRGWHYAVLPQDSRIEIEAMETAKRPVRIEAGTSVVHNAASVIIIRDKQKSLSLMFDPHEHLGERIIREQFML